MQEEALGRDNRGDGTSNELSEENLQLKLLLEEKVQQLEERNFLLIKARNAIENLQAELELSQAEANEFRRSGFDLASKRVQESEDKCAKMEAKMNVLQSNDERQKEEVTKLVTVLKERDASLHLLENQVKALEKLKDSLAAQVATKDR